MFWSHSTHLSKFKEILNNVLSKAPESCPTLTVGDFNVNIVKSMGPTLDS